MKAKQTIKFDHMTMPVSNVSRSRDWYVKNLGFEVEFESRGIAAIRDSSDFTIFLQKAKGKLSGERIVLTLRVKSVDQKHQELVDKGIRFVNSPKRLFWGYGAELLDPDSYLVRLWDRKTMRKYSN